MIRVERLLSTRDIKWT